MAENQSVEFFETQFQRQVREREYALNPFETRALDYLAGTVLDFGCGLGNLALEAGRRGHRVVAVDASPAAIDRINTTAQQEGLPVTAIRADIETWTIDQRYDTIVAIGCSCFSGARERWSCSPPSRSTSTPGGRAIVNVLMEGTTFLGMFHANNYCLFARDEIEERFAGWRILDSRHETFPAPGETRKEFSTVIAEKP